MASVEDGSEHTITLGLYDVILPCRTFRIDHKAAEVGKVSITSEFLLRLLKSVGKMREEAVASYFGFDLREMEFVLNEVEAEDLVLRSDGWLSLTINGEGVFHSGSEEPEIYEVELRTGNYGFDLIAMAPQQKEHLSIFETRLPELAIVDTYRVSESTKSVASSFKRFYPELAPRRSSGKSGRRTLYSIDNVEPKERFSSVVRILVTANETKPAEGDTDLSEWRPEFEVTDREDIVTAAAKFTESLRGNRRADDSDAYAQLIRLAPDFFKPFTRNESLVVERFYRNAFTRVGDVRRNRQTIPILGSLFTPDNARRLIDMAGHGLRTLNDTPETIYWLPPQALCWGSTSTLPELVDHLKEALTNRNEENGLSVSRPQAIALCQGKPAQWTEKAFDHCNQLDRLQIPAGVEVLLVPGAFAAVLVHAVVGAQSGHAVPLGFVSCDLQIVNQVTALLRNVAPAFQLSELLSRDLSVLESSEDDE